jgi:hypothetical protein
MLATMTGAAVASAGDEETGEAASPLHNGG